MDGWIHMPSSRTAMLAVNRFVSSHLCIEWAREQLLRDLCPALVRRRRVTIELVQQLAGLCSAQKAQTQFRRGHLQEEL
eukprot:363371-Chlamydomonas_euryale.AAC.14